MGHYPVRRAWNYAMLTAATLCAIASVGVLLLILGYILINGLHYVNLDFLKNMPRPLGESGGGVANSVVGSLIMVGMGSAIGIPAGLGAGVFLSEYAGARWSTAVRFVADVLSGVPSIVVGIFVYLLLVVYMGGFSALAGAVALGIIMAPIVTRTSEEMLRLVPHSQREAALALGIPQWRTILSVVIPAARRGLVTGGLLAAARAAGESAPLLFTALGNRFWTLNPTEAMDALPLRIYRYGIGPYDEWHQQAWAAAFVLVMAVLLISLLARRLVSR